MKKEHLYEIKNAMYRFAKDSAHDAEHVIRVLNHALKIAENYQINMDILVAACLLHDIGRPAQYSDPNVCHAVAGSKMAYNILSELGWSDADCSAVEHCVLTHRFRNTRQPQTIEAKILFDADKLDVIGALGIARTLQFEGQMKETLKDFFKECDRKLFKLYDVFYTKEAKEFAAGRKQFLELFCKELKDQLDTSAAEAFLKETG